MKAVPHGYQTVLSDLTKLIGDARRRAASAVNRELVLLYWQIGAVIVQQQEKAKWGDAVVKQLAADLRLAFPDLKGLTRDDLLRMRQYVVAYGEVDEWLSEEFAQPPTSPALSASGEKAGALTRQGTEKIGPAPRQLETPRHRVEKLGTVCQQNELVGADEKVATVSRLLGSPDLVDLVASLSWTHHYTIVGATETPAERYFYLKMAVRERWSVRELRRQIDAALFTRYVSVRGHPEKCLPEDAESGDLLPFKDHYVLSRCSQGSRQGHF